MALPKDRIHVADGTYRPDQGSGQTPGDRAATFLLANGVTWKGGFPGCGAIDANESDPRLHKSILSGDLAGDDALPSGSTSENGYHVISAFFVDAAEIHGFMITGGHADGSDPHNRGGGLYNSGAWPQIDTCVFQNNVGTFGGAINSEGGNLTLRNTVFLGNAAGFSGGAIRGWQSGHAIDNCLFVGNSAEAGGVAWFGASTGAIRRCTLTENSAPSGNALAFDSCCPQQPSFVEVIDSILWNGRDEIANDDFSAISVTYSIVAGGLPGLGNVDEDPMFVPGPAGCYYLSQLAAGEPQDSPAVDAGSTLAGNLSGLGGRFTRSDEANDDDFVDMGYHFYYTGAVLVMGDFDRSLRVDLRDFARLQECFTSDGPVVVPPCCRIFDFELDADVDVEDADAFASAMLGP